MSLERIKLNVAGEIIETYKETLINNSVYFNNIFTKFEHNTTEPIFIDEDPTIFKHILNYLRDPRYPIPFNLEYKLDWYGINKIDLNSEINNIEKENLEIKKIESIKYDDKFNIVDSSGSHLLKLVFQNIKQEEHSIL